MPDGLGLDAELSTAQLNADLPEADPHRVLEAALDSFGDSFALVSSFGSESAVLLHLASEVSRDIPVIFLDTGKLFGETKRYRDQLIAQLGLRDVRTQHPDQQDVDALDPDGSLWVEQTNQCCFIRKVKPLDMALTGFRAWGTGRKRYHGGGRAALPHFEASDGRVKVNPIAFWTREDVLQYREKTGLPDHPLVAEGFLSVGCMPCTDRTDDSSDIRSGRWAGRTKSECGIHLTMKENRERVSLDAAAL